jgi:rare lipoprotein A
VGGGIMLENDVLRRIVVLFYLFVGALLIASCSSISEPRDGAPARAVDVSGIPDAQPAPVVRTRAGNVKRYTVLGKAYDTMADSQGYGERGIASWYGTKFHGRRTANGEVYDMYAMTAAHKTLPIPSYVRVTHVGNGRSIVVKINDRGPFVGNRIIDLSYVAARKLGVDATGTALVDVVDVTPVSSSSSGAQGPVYLAVSTDKNKASWYVQLGAFSLQQKAVSLKTRVSGVIPELVGIIQGEDGLHRVVVGPIGNQQRILALQRSLKQKGLDAGYVTRKIVN